LTCACADYKEKETLEEKLGGPMFFLMRKDTKGFELM
jgi:hypothetical protein